MKKDRKLVLGLDPGIASCGFALIDINNHEILEMGSHLFDAPQEDKKKTSLAVVRRTARSARRNNKRTKDRQKHCMNLLKKYGLIPKDASRQWFQSQSGDRPILELRASGLDRKLTNRELAQILYSISGRRGYIPHGEGDKVSKGSESGKVLAALSDNSEKLQRYRTVGEMLFHEGSSRNKGDTYKHCVKNEDLVAEIHAIFECQRKYGNTVATQQLEDDYEKNLTWEKEQAHHDQRIYEKVGNCSYFPEEKRAAKADLSSELCNAYERLGHIVLVDQDGCKSTLNNHQRTKYIDQMFAPTHASKKLTYATIRKDLDLPSTTIFKGIEDTNEEKDTEVFQPKAWRTVQKKLSENLLQKMLDNRELADSIFEALTYASTLQSLESQLEQLSLNQDEIAEIKTLPYSSKVFKGYASRSRKALSLLLDTFLQGNVQTLADAERESGLYNQRFANNDFERSGFLQPYEEYDETCTNPVVLRSISRMRKIINAVIRLHDVPDEIHIELARELKHSVREKKLIAKRQSKNKTNKRNWKSNIATIKGCSEEDITGKDLLKYALYEEQDQKDAYTGEPIEIERMICEENYCQIDHILPYSRTCDDSRNNKALVLAQSNQEKGNRTPFEWMNKDSNAPSWDEFKYRVLANGNYSARKKHAYLLNTNLDAETEKDFLNRNLNDTRYMSRAVKSYIEDSLNFPSGDQKQHVFAVAGGATAVLRRVWGLNFGRKNTKDRDDDRHHAVDACVIAACSSKIVQKVALESSRGKHQSRLANTQPWETFAEDVIERYKQVVPTRMVNHNVTGRAFEETAYRFDGFDEDGYPLVYYHKAEQPIRAGNIVRGKDGNARLLDGVAYVNLWLDLEAKNGKGEWYADPVYYGEIPFVRNGSYVPKALKAHVARCNSEAIPKSAMTRPPIRLFHNDVLEVDANE